MIAYLRHPLRALFGAALLIGIVHALPLPAQTVSGAQGGTLVVVGGETIDFGTVKSGIHRKQLILKNTGPDTLRFLGGLSTDCGCVSAETSGDMIPPGDSVTVELTLLVAGSSKSEARRLTISTNDPARPEVNVKLRMNVVNDLEVTPPTFLVKPSEKGGTATVVIRNTGDEPVTIGAPTLADTGAMKVTLKVGETRLMPGEKLTVTALVRTPTKAVAPGYALFRTSSIGQPEIRVYFVGKE